MKTPISLASGFLLGAAALFYSQNEASAQITYFGDPYLGFGYAKYAQSDLKREEVGEIAGTAGSLSEEAETSNEFHILYGSHAVLGEHASIPVKLEIEGSHARIKGTGTVYSHSENEDRTRIGGYKGDLTVSTIAVNGIFHHALDNEFAVGIGAGIGYSRINIGDVRGTAELAGMETNIHDVPGLAFHDDENNFRVNSILEVTYEIIEDTKISLRHSFVKFPGSDVLEDTYSKFGIGVHFAL